MFYLIQIFSIYIDYSFQKTVLDMPDAPGWVCVLLDLDLLYTCTLTFIISLSLPSPSVVSLEGKPWTKKCCTIFQQVCSSQTELQLKFWLDVIRKP